MSMKKLYCIPRPEQIDQYISFSKHYDAGFEYSICEVDISSRESILNIIDHAKKYGEITN